MRDAGTVCNAARSRYSEHLETGDTLRRHYLAAMGITVWERRERLPSTPVPAAIAASPEPESAPLLAMVVPAALPSVVHGLNVGHMGWEEVAQTVAACTFCELHCTRTQTVFGVGHRTAQWLFVGEAPGAEEDKQGEPFVGAAGQLLNAMLHALGLKRHEVYIANVLKCRPPNNRDPRPAEVESCEPYLVRQIQLLQPRVIVALGRHAAHSLLKSDLPLGKLRARQHTYQGIPLVATYHPAYLLRTPSDKRKAWEDLCLARTVMQVTT